jgi:hypothetical protein
MYYTAMQWLAAKVVRCIELDRRTAAVAGHRPLRQRIKAHSVIAALVLGERRIDYCIGLHFALHDGLDLLAL